MDRVVACFADVGRCGRGASRSEINCHHNYTEQEKHFGKEVWLSRKGAIDAAAGPARADPGLDGHGVLRRGGQGQRAGAELVAARCRPGVLAVEGARGRSPATSCGRRWSGIEYRDTDAFIDEIPAAYKDIDQVMADAADLVEVRHTLRQIVNVKGD